MNWDDAFKIIFAGLATTALSGVVIFGLSNWLGKIWANRILEKEKNIFKKEIEKYKLELDKARYDYQRYSSKKFLIIEETWNAMFEIVKELKIFKENMIKNLIVKNRSYRRFYENHSISESTLRDLIELARLSPSASNLQPLKYYLSSDSKINDKIFDSIDIFVSIFKNNNRKLIKLMSQKIYFKKILF